MYEYLSKKNGLKVKALKEMFYQYMDEGIKSTTDERKSFYRGKRAAIKEVSMKFFNIDLGEAT